MFKFNRKVFFDGYREAFGRIRTNELVAALEQLLGFLEKDPSIESIAEAAYMLATAKWETGHTFEPRTTEVGGMAYIERLYDPVKGKSKRYRDRAVRMGNINAGDGWKYRARGYVGLTWGLNYQKFEELLGIPLHSNPSLALEPAYAYAIMSAGMNKGMFTGKAIDSTLEKDLAEDGKIDYLEARKVVNGMDRASEIADIAIKFEQILTAAQIDETEHHETQFLSLVEKLDAALGSLVALRKELQAMTSE